MNWKKYFKVLEQLPVIRMQFKRQFTSSMSSMLLVDVLCLLLPIGSLLLWFTALKSVQIRYMTDLGIISILPFSVITAIIILIISFSIILQKVQRYEVVALLHLVLLIFMLYGITILAEEAPRFEVVYRHAGYAEYIMRTGSVNPNLDTYFSWPGLFILSAFLAQALGYHDVLSFVGWAPIFFNLIYLGPLYVIFTTATKDKRLIWLGLLFFYLINWIGQDYFSPQGLNFFLYLIIIAVLLKWFKATPVKQPYVQKLYWRPLRPLLSPVQRIYKWLTEPVIFSSPCQPKQRIAMLGIIITVFAFSVFSHPLTPFFILTSVTVLVVFCRCGPLWLPILMAAMIAGWMIFMAQPFLIGHMSMIIGDLGRVNNSISANVTDRVVHGSQEHSFIVMMRMLMTGVVWGLAALGGVRRYRQGYYDIPYILLAIAPFSIIVAQSYGGEMILRIYLFSLPMMSFFCATLFYPSASQGKSLWTTIAVGCVSIALLGGFLFTRYGNERMDYMTYDEVAGVHRLYSIAQPHSLLLECWGGVPWRFQGYEAHMYNSMQPILGSAIYHSVSTKEVNMIVKSIKEANRPNTYVICTRSAKATGSLLSGLPQGTLDRLEDVLLKSGKFKLVYRHSDAQILQYIGK